MIINNRFKFVVPLIALLLVISCNNEKHIDSNNTATSPTKTIDAAKRMKLQIDQLLPYIQNNPQYSKERIFLVDMRIPSGKKRFFVYDVNTKSVIHKGLVTHGSGSVLHNSDSLVFKNIPESRATSLGKYAIGNSYVGTFGKAYKLHGLDRTNSKAFERFIVLHYHACVPDIEMLDGICLSYGCPTVSPNFFSKLEKIIGESNKKILLSIYY